MINFQALFETTADIIQLAKENNKAPQNAGQNPSTSNPLTIEDENQNMSALITRVKSPRVKTFTGRVKISINGRISALTIPNTITVIMAAYQPPSLMPSTNFEIKTKDPALSAIRKRNNINQILKVNKTKSSIT